MNDERVFQLLRETNPVPDPDGLHSPIALAPVELAASEQVPTQVGGTRPARDPNRRGRLLAGAVAAVLVLIAGAGMLTVFGGEDNDAAVTTVSVPPSPFPVPEGVTRVIDSQDGHLELEYPGSEAEAIAAFYEEWTSGQGAWIASEDGFGAGAIAGFVANNGDSIDVLLETPDSETILLLSWTNDSNGTPPSTP